MSAKKRALQILIFLLVMFLTFYALFSGRDLGEIIRAAAKKPNQVPAAKNTAPVHMVNPTG